MKILNFSVIVRFGLVLKFSAQAFSQTYSAYALCLGLVLRLRLSA